MRRHRRRRQHGHGRHPRGRSRRGSVRLRDAVLHRDGDRVDAVRLRYHSAPVPAALRRRRRRAATPQLEVELGEAFFGASPGQTAVLLAGEAIVGHGTIAAAA